MRAILVALAPIVVAATGALASTSLRAEPRAPIDLRARTVAFGITGLG